MSIRVQVCRIGSQAEPALFWVDEEDFNQRVIFDTTGLACCGEFFPMHEVAHVHVDDTVVEPPRNASWN